jgi:benzoyl-CoA reductase/2-hydroxyglutaryl-CoA dehydratase subunit BcrC/BadD/HgdB
MNMTLETLARFEEALKRRPAEIADARHDGKKVIGWIGYYVPEEMIHALGLIPVRVGHGGDDRLAELGSNYISTQNCIFLRECVGLFAENQDPYVKSLDAVVVDAACLQMFRMSSIIKYYFKVNTLVLGVPRNYYLPEGREYFRKEVEFLAERLEKIAGHKLDPEKLAASVKLYEDIGRAVRELYKFPSLYCQRITWREVFEAVQAGYVLDKEKYLELLTELIAELKEKSASGESACVEKGTRVFLTGSAIHPGDTKLIDIIEASGGRVVCDNLWSGLAPYIDKKVEDATLGGIADAYLGRVPAPALPYYDGATDPRLKALKRLVAEHEVDGIIYYTLRYCDSANFKVRNTKNAMAEEGVPLLNIHTEYSGSDTGAIRTRVEAFIEMLGTADAEEMKP